MKSNTKQRALAPIVIGLLGMAAYPVIVRLGHPAQMENDFFHGLWFGLCVGLEILGVYRLSKNSKEASNTMSPKTAIAFGAVIAIIIAGVALLRHSDPAQAGFIYLLDARHDSSRPFSQLLPVSKELERKGYKVIVGTARSMHLLTDYRAMFEEFDKTQDAVPPSPMFFVLDKPYTTAKMALRGAVEGSERGDIRARLLRRLVVVRDTKGLAEGDECAQLSDGILYASDNFLGTGLLIDDDTLQELKKCVDVFVSAT